MERHELSIIYASVTENQSEKALSTKRRRVTRLCNEPQKRPSSKRKAVGRWTGLGLSEAE